MWICKYHKNELLINFWWRTLATVNSSRWQKVLFCRNLSRNCILSLDIIHIPFLRKTEKIKNWAYVRKLLIQKASIVDMSLSQGRFSSTSYFIMPYKITIDVLNWVRILVSLLLFNVLETLNNNGLNIAQICLIS